MLVLTLRRHAATDESVWGTLLIEDSPVCATLEGVPRALPGRYRMTITPSRRFERQMPLIEDVPDLEFVRLHPGGIEADMTGCIQVGEVSDERAMINSQPIFDQLFAIIDEANGNGDVFIEIEEVSP